MARLPALIDALTAVDGRPRKAVDHVAREVREEGLIQTSGRGRAAAHMTAVDAAYLIIGLYAAATPGEAKAAARELSTLKGFWLGIKPAELRPLKTAPDLVHTIAALIELAPLIAPSIGLSEPALDSGSIGPMHPEVGYAVHLLFHRPKRSVQLRLARRDRKRDIWDREVIEVMFDGPGQSNEQAAVETVTRVTGPVFRAAYDVLFHNERAYRGVTPGHKASARAG
jgi:hypothetical protein